MMRNGLIWLIGLGIAGCASVEFAPSPLGEAAPPSPPKNADYRIAMHYGRWIEKGPKIVDEEGRPLLDAEVDLDGERLPLDKDGRIVLRRYVSVSGGAGARVSVRCPGYHSRRSQPILYVGRALETIPMRKIRNPHPMKALESSFTFQETGGSNRFPYDLLLGDLLPPYGFGEHADVVFDVGSRKITEPAWTSIYPASCKRVVMRSETTVTMTLQGENDGAYESDYDDLFDELRFAYEVDPAFCTNRTMAVRGNYTPHKPIYLRARGCYGALEVNLGWGSGQSRRIEIRGRMNTLPGEAGLERGADDPVAVLPPIYHPAPEGANFHALGLSEDGRAAVYFGKTGEGAFVPEIFRRAVYTVAPSNDLAHVEMLYVGSSGNLPPRAFANLPELKTVAFSASGCRELGEKAFAYCPKLEAVLFSREDSRKIIAADAFEGAANRPVAVFAAMNFGVDGLWREIAVTNLFSRMVEINVMHQQRSEALFRPETDLRRGTVELPIYRLGEESLEKCDSRGRKTLYLKSGKEERWLK